MSTQKTDAFRHYSLNGLAIRFREEEQGTYRLFVGNLFACDLDESHLSVLAEVAESIIEDLPKESSKSNSVVIVNSFRVYKLKDITIDRIDQYDSFLRLYVGDNLVAVLSKSDLDTLVRLLRSVLADIQ